MRNGQQATKRCAYNEERKRDQRAVNGKAMKNKHVPSPTRTVVKSHSRALLKDSPQSPF